MNKFIQLLFPKKGESTPDIEDSVISEAVKPPDDVIDSVIKESFTGLVARQWVNWAAEQIGEDKKYFLGYPITVRSVWVFYEGCRVYSAMKGGDNEQRRN